MVGDNNLQLVDSLHYLGRIEIEVGISPFFTFAFPEHHQVTDDEEIYLLDGRKSEYLLTCYFLSLREKALTQLRSKALCVGFNGFSVDLFFHVNRSGKDTTQLREGKVFLPGSPINLSIRKLILGIE